MTTRALPDYVPPTGDEPLDAVEEAIVNMWVKIVVRRLRAKLAAEQAAAEAERASETQPSAGS